MARFDAVVRELTLQPKLAALACLMASLPGLAFADTTLFFHWGDVQGNRTLLENGGYPLPAHGSHFDDLTHSDGTADINEQVLAKSRQWYENAGQRDVAGAGFYMAYDPMNSSNFGNDLLIVEAVHDAATSPRGVTSSSNAIKTQADAALKSGDFASLPLVTGYNHLGWHVVSRPPTPEEAKKVRYVFRPPRAEDVPRIWERLIQSEGTTAEFPEILDRIMVIARRFSKGSAKQTPLTRSSEIVLHRLFFDHAFEHIARELPLDSAFFKPGFKPGFERVKAVFDVFAERLPQDERTNRFFRMIFDKIKKAPTGLETGPILDFIGHNAHRLLPAERAELVGWVMRSFDPALLKERFPSLVELIGACVDELSPADRSLARKFVFEHSRGATIDFNEYAKSLPLMERILGKDQAESLLQESFARRTRQMAGELGFHYNHNPKPGMSSARNAEAATKWTREQTLAIAQYAEAHPGPASDRLIRQFLEPLLAAKIPEKQLGPVQEATVSLLMRTTDPALKSRLHGWVTHRSLDTARRLEQHTNAPHYDSSQDPRYRSALLKFAKELKLAGADVSTEKGVQALQKSLYSDRRNWNRLQKIAANFEPRLPDISFAIDPFRSAFEQWLAEPGMTADEFEKRVKQAIHEFPDLGMRIAKSITDARKYQETELPVQWSRLEDEAKRSISQSAILDTEARSAYAELRRYRSTRGKDLAHHPEIPWEEFRKSYRRVVQPIEGSPAYSEMLRTFALVDPLFVSEDLRLNHANAPFRRFNENLRRNGSEITQPAWENFNSAWNKLAQRTWFSNVERDLKSKGYYHTSVLEAHDRLMATQVDGSKPGDYATDGLKPWDRGKYETFVSDAEYKDWGLELRNSPIARYFTVEPAPGGYKLKFKDTKALTAALPGLSRYERPEAMFNYRLLKFIYRDANKLKDPIQRASRILYLQTRIHPFENGNGRLGRLLASMELSKAGYPMPVGLPTNDFFMSQRRIELEVRKAIKLGEFWQKMVQDAHSRGVPPDQFFQKEFRGSALEGLMHIAPQNEAEFASYVDWLYRQNEPPAWGKDLALAFERRISEVHRSGGTLAKISESERFALADEVWKSFRAQHAATNSEVFPPAELGTGPGKCSLKSVSAQLRLMPH